MSAPQGAAAFLRGCSSGIGVMQAPMPEELGRAKDTDLGVKKCGTKAAKSVISVGFSSLAIGAPAEVVLFDPVRSAVR